MGYNIPEDHHGGLPEPKNAPAVPAVGKTCSTAERWSEFDETSFKEMQARRERVQGARRAALQNAMANALMYIGSDGDAQRLLDQMIADANAVRDALAPYDSGVRPTEKPFINY